MKAISFILEADPRLSEKGKRIARSTIAELNVVVPYEAKSNDSIERCGTKDFLSSLSPEVYLCPATVDALTNPTERDVLILAQRLIRWGQIRSSDFPRIACQGSEFELTVMQRTSVGIQTTRSIDEEPVSCSPELAKFRPEETPRPTQSRRLRTQEDSPSWGEVILGSVLTAGQSYVDQRNQLEESRRARDRRIATEQQSLYQQRMQQVNAENAVEEARRAQWQQQQSQQTTSFSGSSTYTSTRSQHSGTSTESLTKRTVSATPIVSVRFTHDIRDGGVGGQVSNIIVYANNTGNVAIDCDVWLKGAFWNDRAGPGMGSDQSLSSITTERRNVIGLRPGERRQVMALSHHVTGSRFDYDGGCKPSFTD